jgi:hypothetical protein
MTLRSENGKREVAEQLHLQFNKQLQCPTCSFTCRIGGAFNKDSGGNRDDKGHFYRRFKCRARPRCGKTLGVTEFIKLCHNIDYKTVSALLASIDSSTTGMDHYFQYNILLTKNNSTITVHFHKLFGIYN